ncbi:MAG: phage tail protein [Winogradskyella sp.]|nr:MAG: phage tail protein [Winogradskyella sp.]
MGNAQESYLGDIKLTAVNFDQRGWMECDGRLLKISDHNALFALLGTQYGGDGRTTFALPDLRGRVPVGQGSAPGLTTRRQGEKGGVENGTQKAVKPDENGTYSDSTSTNMQPYTVIRYVICVNGIFPSRS